jgi:hypothetical protein
MGPTPPSPMNHPSILTLVLIPALAFAFPAQARLKEATMRLPDELSQTPRLTVQGRQGWKLTERLKFGEFSVHDVQRSLTKGGDLQILFYEGSKRRQTFGFTLSEGGTPLWLGAAATNLHRRTLESDDGFEIELRNKSGFAVRLSPLAAADKAWTLELTEKREKPLQGTLSQGNQVILVQGTNLLAGTPFPLGETSGYVFESGGRVAAAVEVINDGAVWLSPGLDPTLRAPVTAAISALLLFEELRATLPE